MHSEIYKIKITKIFWRTNCGCSSNKWRNSTLKNKYFVRDLSKYNFLKQNKFYSHYCLVFYYIFAVLSDFISSEQLVSTKKKHQNINKNKNWKSPRIMLKWRHFKAIFSQHTCYAKYWIRIVSFEPLGP